MTQCPGRDQLERLLDARCGDDAGEELVRHVEGCSACQQALESLTGAADWGPGLEGWPAPAGRPSPQPDSFLRRLAQAPPWAIDRGMRCTDPMPGDGRGSPTGLSGLAPSPWGSGSPSVDDRVGRAAPAVAGYEILGELGRGGMGVVYRARQVRLDRPCALKMILAGAHADPELAARFLAEAVAIARLQHPHVVQIHHIGEAEGLPFLELEYVEGGSLDRQLDGIPWTPGRAARLAEQLAGGIAEAHRLGIVHRDLKPGNVLLAGDGTPKITDFGLAKALGSDSGLTRTESILGSPSYMAPEQAEGRARQAGPAADIYAVGAILYELLTGRPPFRAATVLETVEQVKAADPVPPSRLVPGLPRDLETICLKCLAKEPGQRYQAATELADDLRRFQAGEPIRARRISGAERAWRWCKRDPRLAGASIAAATVTVALAVVSTAAAIVYRNQAEALRVERNRSDGALLDARWRAVDAYTAQARGGRFSRRPGQRFETLEAVKQAAKLLDGLPSGPDIAPRRDELRDLAIAALALPDLRPTGQVITRPMDVIATAFDAAMDRYALRFRGGAISVRRVADGQEIAPFQARGDREFWIFFSPDGRHLATTHFPGGALTVWDVDRRAVAVNDPGPIELAARFSPDSRRIVVGRRGELVVYDLATSRLIRRWPGNARCVAFGPDGAQLAVIDDASNPPTGRILDAESGRQLRAFPMRAITDDVAWSPDGTMLATTSPDFKIDLWDAATGTRRAILEGLTNAGLKASFHPAGTLLASNGWEGRLRLWDPILGRPLLNLTSYFGPDFSRDGRIVLSNEDKLAICEVDPAREYRTLIPASRELTDYEDAVFRHDGRLLAVGTNRGAVLWDLARGTEIAFLSIGNSWHLMFDPSGDLITSGGMGVQRWPIQFDAGRGELRVGPPRQLPLPGGNCGIAADRSGRIVAKAYYTEVHVAMAEGTTRVLPANDCRYVAVSPDGRWMATGTHPPAHGARVWSIPDLTRVAELPLDDSTWVVFSPDGKWLMTGVAPCRLWEVGTWREARRIGDRFGSFSPDGRLMAVQGASKLIRLVETESGRTLARLENPDLSIIQPTFSPDGSRLVVTTKDGPAVHVWDLWAIRERLATMGLDWDAPAYPDVDPAAPSAPRFTRVRIDDLDHLNAEVTALMQEGRWDEAAADYARFLASGDQQAPWAWFENAVIHLALGREAVYRSTCRHMLDVVRKTHQTSWLEYAAHAWVLAPAGPDEQAQALELAEQRASAIRSTWCEHVLGLALYRNGRFAKAETLLLDSLHRNPNWEWQILDWLVLSMAKHRLGQPEEARRWLDRAERWVVDRLKGRPGRFDRAIPENWIWRNGIFMHLLLREARALIGADLPMLPGEVFAPAP